MKPHLSRLQLDRLDDLTTLFVGATIGLLAFFALTFLPIQASSQNQGHPTVAQSTPLYAGSDLSPSEAAGLQVMSIDPGSVYEAMDLEAGDILLEVNQRQIRREQELNQIFNHMQPGNRFEYSVERNGELLTGEAELPLNYQMDPTLRPRQPIPAATPMSPWGPGQGQPIEPGPIPPASARPVVR